MRKEIENLTLRGVQRVNTNDNFRELFGVEPNGDLSGDQTNIQAAIEAAKLVGGTVKIYSGDFYITSPLILRSLVHIDIHKNAKFSFPSGYTDGMFVNEAEILVGCQVSGGRYIGITPTWNCISLYGTHLTTAYCMANRFTDMWIENCKHAIDLDTDTGGWVNGNTFDNIWAWNCVRGIKSTLSLTGTNGIDGNLFSTIQIQQGDNSLFGIDFEHGSYNIFSNILLWDFLEGVTTLKFGEYANWNRFNGLMPGKPADDYVDLGNGNLIETNNTITFGTNKKIVEKCTEYADNSAALTAGLIAGMKYRTGDLLKIVH